MKKIKVQISWEVATEPDCGWERISTVEEEHEVWLDHGDGLLDSLGEIIQLGAKLGIKTRPKDEELPAAAIAVRPIVLVTGIRPA